MSRTTYDVIDNRTTVWIKSRGPRERERYGKWRPLFWFPGRAR